MPVHRGELIAEVKLTGRAKRFLDVLLWIPVATETDVAALDQVEILRMYLQDIDPFVCGIRLYVLERHTELASLLADRDIAYETVQESEGEEQLRRHLEGCAPGFQEAVSTARFLDFDCLVTNDAGCLSFVEVVQKHAGLLVTDCGFLLPYSEIFVRGHDVPWSFSRKILWQPWNAFYQLGEPWTFKSGIELLHRAAQSAAPVDAQETGRLLVHNRLPALCFTRDRLFFFESQRLVATRRGWKRQNFSFEIAYFLNYNYQLIFGG